MSRSPLIADLDAALKALDVVHRSPTTQAFLAGEDVVTPRYVVDPRVRLAAHFDLAPSMLVFDPLLATLGIVEEVTTLTTVEDDVKRHVDTAIYARHLSLRAKGANNPAPLTVELVLVVPDESNAGSPVDIVAQVGVVLGKLLANADVLPHIGIGLLRHGGPGVAYRGRLRRAFPWLLCATRKRLLVTRGARPAVVASNDGSRRLSRVTLTNYRLPGRRSLVFQPSRIHLVHGPNGSGKSSLVEALELVTTGKVERLSRARATDYASIIRNRHQGGDATIELSWGSANPDTPRIVTPEGIDRRLSEGDCDAGAFRLDQPLMDRLIGLLPNERATVFLSSFFPEAKSSLERYTEASQARKAALEAGASTVASLEGAQRALVTLKDAKARTTETPVEAYPILLNRWLERTALADLAQRERAVRSTLEDARNTGWKPREPLVVATATAIGTHASDLASLRRLEQECLDEAEAIHRQLASFSPTRTSEVTSAPPASVTTEHVAALNQVARWLFTEEELQQFGPFGDKVSRVFNAGDAPTYGPIIIGSPDWTAHLKAQLDALIDAWSTLSSEKPAAAWPGKTPCAAYDAAADKHKAVLGAGIEISDGFFKHLLPDGSAPGEFDGSLIAAINELMALFTPARWGYEDIRLPSRFASGRIDLNIELGEGEHRAELHLNTAELNLFTIALFLLCTSRVRNALGLVVLDDPLQNMDELTSTALARGLAKIVRLWKHLGLPEEILVLFHGYDDLERFRAELGAAVYHLPWLTPRPQVDTPDIEFERATVDPFVIQSIAALIEPQ